MKAEPTIRPTGALLLTIYRDDLRKTVAQADPIDPLFKAAALEMAGVLALNEGRRITAQRYFDRANDVLAALGRIPAAKP